MKKYQVHLTSREHERLGALVAIGKASRRALTRARILLLCNNGLTDLLIAKLTHTSVPTVERTRRKFTQGGVARATRDRPREAMPKKVDLYLTARLTALVNSHPPAGRRR